MFSKIPELITKCKNYYRNTAGTIIVLFALMVPLIVGSAGFALDFAQAYLVQQRLAQAIDAAALAAAASESDPVKIEQKVKDFFDINYPPEELGVVFTPVVVVEGGQISVTGTAEYKTGFLSLIGIEEMSINAYTQVQIQVQGLEVAMVLDNTGSMWTNNNIEALKGATESFINIMFSKVANPTDIKIGLVPYANSVRVGRYGLGLNPDGTNYAGEPFVELPSGVTYTTDKTSDDWYGCVLEHNDNGYSSGATHVSGSKGQLWETGGNWNGHGWNPESNYNDPYDYDVLDNYEGPWDPYMYGRVISQNQKCSSYSGYSNSRCSDCTGSSSKCASEYCFCWRSDSSHGTSRSCPYAYIVPLTSDQDSLLDGVDDMRAHGYTLGNIGMSWGYRLLSPEAPFEEGAGWDDPDWRKAVIMMTDGANTNEGTYSSYWFDSKHNMTVTKYNDRFVETCDAMKAQGITIYTVTFYSNISESTKQYYKDCATTEAQYYDAPTQEELNDVFETIALELSNLYISY